MRKIPFAGIELTSQRVRGLRGTSELPGRPAYNSEMGKKCTVHPMLDAHQAVPTGALRPTESRALPQDPNG